MRKRGTLCASLKAAAVRQPPHGRLRGSCAQRDVVSARFRRFTLNCQPFKQQQSRAMELQVRATAWWHLCLLLYPVSAVVPPNCSLTEQWILTTPDYSIGCNYGGGGGNLWPVKRFNYEHTPRFIFSKALTY